MACFGRDERAKRLRPVLTEIRKIIDTKLERDIKPQCLQKLAAQEARLGLFTEAMASAESIDPSDADDLKSGAMGEMGSFKKAEAFADIASARLEAGDLQGARQAAWRAFEVANAMKIQSDRSFPLLRATQLLIRAGDRQGARRAVDTMARPLSFSMLDILRELARAEARWGEQASARADWSKALKLAKDEHQPTAAISEIQAEMGDVAAALETAGTVAADGRQEALRRVAVALANTGRLEGAVTVVEKISAPEVRNRAWIDIVTWTPGR